MLVLRFVEYLKSGSRINVFEGFVIIVVFVLFYFIFIGG